MQLTPTAALNLHQSWLTIWSAPRQTIRRIVDANPEYGSDLIAVLWFLFWSTVPGSSTNWAPEGYSHGMAAFGVLAALFFALVSAVVLAKLFLYLYNACLYASGRVLGGRAGYLANWAVLGWSMLPGVVIGVLKTLLRLMLPAQLLPSLTLLPGVSVFILSSGLFVLSLLSLICQGYFLVAGLMEIQGFSALRAVSGAILAALFFLLLIPACIGLFMLVTRLIAG